MSKEIIASVAKIVEERFSEEGSGHDWWHMYRVWQLSKKLGKAEGSDPFVTELGALLHDIADFKFHDGDLSAGPREARKILEELGVDEVVVRAVCHIVENVSYKGAGEKNKMQGLEGKVVQDADRLDAIGAIGISRVFSYSGSKGRLIHHPDQKPELHATFEAYKSSQGTSINHFYEKLLLLKDRMNTKSGKKMAERRHQFMEEYLKEFYAEWSAEK